MATLGILIVLLAGAGLIAWGRERRHRRTHPVPPGLQPEIDLPFEQEFELYHNTLSLCSMKTRVCLAELQIDYASHPIDLIETGSYETLSRHFLAVNPGGTVPVLVHQGHPVYESHEQIRYAAAHAPPGHPSLVPDDPKLRHEMERWIDLSSLGEDPIEHGDVSAGNAVPGLTLPIFAAMIDRIGYRPILEGLLFHFDRKRPVMFILFKALGLERVGQVPLAVKLIARSRRQMEQHLDAFEKQLTESGGPWILGPTYSLADVSWLVIFERLAQVDALQVFMGEGLRPHCAAYWDRLRARPAYKEGILNHPHPLIAYGTRRIQDAKAAAPALRLALEGGSASAPR
jgi:glutathione S-transferase